MTRQDAADKVDILGQATNATWRELRRIRNKLPGSDGARVRGACNRLERALKLVSEASRILEE